MEGEKIRKKWFEILRKGVMKRNVLGRKDKRLN